MNLKPMSFLQLLQLSFLALLSFTLIRTALTYTQLLLPLLLFSYLLHRHLTRPHPILLLNYSCYKPPHHRKCSFQTSEDFVRRCAHFTPESIHFMRNIFLKSGLGDETYAPPFIFNGPHTPNLKCAIQEAQEGMYSAVDSVLSKTGLDPDAIDLVIVTCGGFTSSPSLSSEIVNRFKLRSDVKTYNLSGMGCSSGVLSIDLASRVLRGSRKVQNALVIITETITLNWYFGENRSMLVTNCIFRVGCAAAVITNDPSRRHAAKMELAGSLRTHHGSDDSAYRAAFQEEDGEGKTGISLTKDLVRVAGVCLRRHITLLAPRVLPLSQLAQFVYFSIFSGGKGKAASPVVPDFTAAFEHICLHTGGKAVIEQVGRVLRLSEEVTEPARMSLHRFGNTSSSLVFYELAYFEAKERVKRGDRMWMIAFGTGFKVGSLVWKWLVDSSMEGDNPWIDCINEYPLKSW